MRYLPLLLLTGVLLALTPNHAAAQDQEYIDQIIAQLEAATEAFSDAGYEALVWDGNVLEPSATHQYTATLEEGNTYVLVGVCDSDCSDLDLTLLDGYDDVVVSDVGVDDAPVIEFTVTSSGEFTINVDMFACEANVCYFGVALFAE